MNRYPPIEPYEHGMLDVGDGHLLHWETCGNPDGKPAVVLHGGPGSGCTPAHRRLFDPQEYRVVLLDQRGAGRSTPHASEPAADLSVNTTEHLLRDLERVREHLGIERWLVYGISWGSTLGLAYAERHPDRVTEVVLAAVTMTRLADVRWLTHEVGRFFPAEWTRFRAGVPEADRHGELVDAYARLLADPDPAVREQAARDWCDWEEAIVSLESGGVPNPRYDDARFRMGFARTVTHYFRHAAWLADDQLLRDAHRLAGIPGVLIHGRLDLGGPLVTAWELAQAWPGSELVVLDTAGHTTQLGDHVVAATDRFARRN
ncbi:MAG: prolyl aminopeptidase [Actinomycetes bacterium]